MLRLRTPILYEELLALQILAQDEMRDPGEQAHFIIRQELERRGLLHRDNKLSDGQHDARTKTISQEVSNETIGGVP